MSYASISPASSEGKLRLSTACASLFHFVLAVTVASLSDRSAVVPVYYDHRVRGYDSYGSMFYLSSEHVGEVNLAYLLFVFELGASLQHGASAIMGGWFHLNLVNRMNPLQWIEYSLTASVMTVLIALECAVLDVLTLMLLGALMWTTMVFGFIYEQTDNVLYFWCGCVPYAAVWSYLIAIFSIAADSSTGGPPDWVWAIITGLFTLMSLFPLAQLYQRGAIIRVPAHTPAALQERYVSGSFVFIVLSFMSKGLLWGLTVGYAFKR